MAKDKPLQRIARSIARKGTKGAFKRKAKRKAKRAGMSTQAYAEAKRSAPGRLGKQARLALVFSRARKRAKKRGASKRGRRR